MKQKLEALLLALVIFTAAYLTGSFVEADFNITHWNPLARIFVGVFGMLFSAMIASLHYNELKNK
jgi:hypothetical protein